jgi:hypothetical protein
MNRDFFWDQFFSLLGLVLSLLALALLYIDHLQKGAK